MLRYGPDQVEDRFGFLGQASLDTGEDRSAHLIGADEFADAWQQTPLLLRAGATLPTVDVDQAAMWQRTMYQMARETGTRIDGPMRSPGARRNYYRLDLHPAEGWRRAVLLNAAVRLVAGYRIADDGSIANAFDVVRGAECFLAAGFRVATATQLALPLRSGHLARLSETERRDVAYHNAQQIAQALFNEFD